MLDFISGKIAEKNPTFMVIENQGVGFLCHISLQTFQKTPDTGQQILLKTYLHVREDALQLFGFSDNNERNVFISLISVSGIGPKLAQTILSGVDVSELSAAIKNEDISRLTKISGIGKKTAERMVIELRDKFKTLGLMPDTGSGKSAETDLNNMELETVMALISLGYKKDAAERALLKIRNGREKVLSVEEMIKKVLQII